MHKTTLYLDDDLYAPVQREIQALVVREAIAAYVVRRKRKSKSVGPGRSGKGDLSERAEELRGRSAVRGGCATPAEAVPSGRFKT